VHYKFIAFNCLKVLKIPTFGNLYKKIKIAQYRLHYAWKQEQDEEMRFQKSQVNYKKSPGFVPVIPLVPMKLSADELKDKSAYIIFTLQISRGAAPGSPSYKKHVRTFEDGDPQQWMEVMTSLREIWLQNSVDIPTDMSNTVVAILKGDSLTAYEAAVEDLTVDPEDDTQVIPLTEDHVELALRAVAETVFPFRALETQKQWMSKHMKKPYDMTAKTMTNAMSKINNFLPYFPDASIESKYSESDLIGILQFAVPDYYRAAFDLRNYIPPDESKTRFIEECERVERSAKPKSHKRDDDGDERRNSKKVKFAKSGNSNKKSGSRSSTEDSSMYCTHCKTDTHTTSSCYKLKKIAKDKADAGKARDKEPYSKRTFRKEVNAIARRAGKHGGIKLVEKAIKREQGKQAKLVKKHEKVARAKKVADTDSESSDESMHNMESRIPRKKRIKNVRLNSKGKVVDIEDSDSEDDRKMPAKISRKKPKKVADPIDSDSESSKNEEVKVHKEEKAFLKSIGVINDKEEYILSSDSESD
jgi:hypothetical protein